MTPTTPLCCAAGAGKLAWAAAILMLLWGASCSNALPGIMQGQGQEQQHPGSGQKQPRNVDRGGVLAALTHNEHLRGVDPLFECAWRRLAYEFAAQVPDPP